MYAGSEENNIGKYSSKSTGTAISVLHCFEMVHLFVIFISVLPAAR